jgi:DNA polymerase-1
MKNLILDGNNILFRAYHILQTPQYVKGVNVSVVSQFLKMVKSYIELHDPKNVFLIFDKRINNGGNFRKTYVAYKENRLFDPKINEDISNCTALIQEIARGLGIKIILPWNLEADDVIAYLVGDANLEGTNIVVTSDKDMLQLVSATTSIYNTSKNNLITLENFEELVGIKLENFLTYKCILGDRSDNVPGVPKYGEVKSKRLAEARNWETLSEEQLQIVERNKIILTLDKSYQHSDGELESYQEQLTQSKDISFDEDMVKYIIKEFNLYSLAKDLPTWRNKMNNANLLEDWFSHL